MFKTRSALALAVGLLAAVPGCGGSDSPASSTGLEPKTVLATANIFGAGFTEAPEPGGGGSGTLPPVWRVPDGARTVTFPKITGFVNPVAHGLHGAGPVNGPDGDHEGPTDVESWQGISGIVHADNGMFLVGVFLNDAKPHDPAPERLDFTDDDDFAELAPQIGQSFFIGNGKGHEYEVPEGATRLFLGFADGFAFVGLPGWYGNNAESLAVTVEFSG